MWLTLPPSFNEILLSQSIWMYIWMYICLVPAFDCHQWLNCPYFCSWYQLKHKHETVFLQQFLFCFFFCSENYRLSIWWLDIFQQPQVLQSHLQRARRATPTRRWPAETIPTSTTAMRYQFHRHFTSSFIWTKVFFAAFPHRYLKFVFGGQL